MRCSQVLLVIQGFIAITGLGFMIAVICLHELITKSTSRMLSYSDYHDTSTRDEEYQVDRRYQSCELPNKKSNVAGQFAIDYKHNTFTLDGEPFQYVAGEMHYFRTPHQYWRDRLRKMRKAGLNAVSTYVEWSQHEPTPRKYIFGGDLNFTKFIDIAREEGLFVILRPGPYICAERDMGGLPFWLLQYHPTIKLRSSDSRYLSEIKRWLDLLLVQIKPLLYGNGGPIIMVQVENEYGSYPVCDHHYLKWLRDLFQYYVQDKAVLFTTDGAASYFLKCGKIDGVYATVDFGSGFDIKKYLDAQRKIEPRGPLVNSEYYSGWLNHWGEDRVVVPVETFMDTLKAMLKAKVNINIYMFHGGSNFGFTAGANFVTNYEADLTSYDYDAPMTEAGELTPKYFEIQKLLLPALSSHAQSPNNYSMILIDKYDDVVLHPVANLFSLTSTMGRAVVKNQKPLSFETMGQSYGYVLYETQVPSTTSATLRIDKLHDRGLVYINDSHKHILDRESQKTRCNIQVNKGDTLRILVENRGRLNYGPFINDSKGILSDVLLGSRKLASWTMTGFPFDKVDAIETCMKQKHCYSNENLIFYAGNFVVKKKKINGFLPDTFINVTSLGKGVIFINGFNLGRYWSTRGPQLSVYLPGVHLKEAPHNNTLIVFDEEYRAEQLTIQFSNKPMWK